MRTPAATHTNLSFSSVTTRLLAAFLAALLLAGLGSGREALAFDPWIGEVANPSQQFVKQEANGSFAERVKHATDDLALPSVSLPFPVAAVVPETFSSSGRLVPASDSLKRARYPPPAV